MKRLSNNPTMDHRRSFLACSFCFVAAFSILLVRLGYFQLWSGEAFRNLSENNRIRVTEIHAPRGRILDANHEILVDNRPCFDVTVIPEEVQDYASLEETLARLSPLPPEVLKEKLAAIRKGVPFRSYVLWKDASWDTAAYLEANRLRMPGVMIQVTQARDYLVQDLFAHSIGYMGEISPRELSGPAGTTIESATGSARSASRSTGKTNCGGKRAACRWRRMQGADRSRSSREKSRPLGRTWSSALSGGSSRGPGKPLGTQREWPSPQTQRTDGSCVT